MVSFDVALRTLYMYMYLSVCVCVCVCACVCGPRWLYLEREVYQWTTFLSFSLELTA